MNEPARSLPALLRTGDYPSGWLRADVIAGLTVAAMLVPQAMAYAELGGLPPSAGFRAALVALPVYAMLGTSRHLGVGPEPGTAVLAALAVAPLAEGDPARYLTLMAALAGIVGVLAIGAAVMRLGFIADLLSKPVLVGYITGVGLTLLSSQLRSFTGADIDADDFFPRFGQFFRRLDTIDGTTTAVGLASLAVMIALRRFRPTVPGALTALVAASAIVAIADLDVALVGSIDAATPQFAVPDITSRDLRRLLAPAAGLLLIAYTDNILTARSIAAKKDYRVDANRELFALGSINLAGALGGGFPVSSSASRSIVPASIGSRTQASSLVAFATVLGFLVVGKGLLAELPRAALAAVVVTAAFAVIDIDGFRRLAAISWTETALAAITCLAIVTTDLLLGVLVALALSGIVTLHRVARPHDAILGQGEGLAGWIDVLDPRATPVPGLLVYRFDAPLFFANAEYFRERLAEAVRVNPTDEGHIILDFEGVGSLDATAADHLLALCREVAATDVSVAIARANHDVLEIMRRSGVTDAIGADAIFPTINAAVDAYHRTGEPPEPER